MSNRTRGDYLEHQTKAALEYHGWLVIRAAGSLGCADLVALRADKKRPWLIQCKLLGKGRQMPRINPTERHALFAAAEKAGARPIIATRYQRGFITFLELPGPQWTQYPDIDLIKVPKRPRKGDL